MHQTDFESKFLIVSIVPQDPTQTETFNNIKEVISLVEAYGGLVEDIVLQKREVHDKGSYVGRGKVDEIGQLVVDKNIDVVVLNGIVKAGQIYDMFTVLETFKLGVQLWDRIDLILKIFAKHANTSEAKLQIELASMRHMGPRIYGMGTEMSRQSGMVGTRGIGETNTERMKRHWKEQTKKVRDELNELNEKRKVLLENRQKTGIRTVSLVGYTNAGKTSIFNSLTNKHKLVQDALFVTLDSVVGKVYLNDLNEEILVSDTIGFISNLPPQLIDAFQSTLMESVYADILLHVIDIADEALEEKINAVDVVLKDLKVTHKKVIYIFNKSDKSNDEQRKMLAEKYSYFTPQFISTKTGEGIEELKNAIAAALSTLN